MEEIQRPGAAAGFVLGSLGRPEDHGGGLEEGRKDEEGGRRSLRGVEGYLPLGLRGSRGE